MAIDTTPIDPNAPLQKKPISWTNLAVGAGLNMFEVSTLGQPFEVIKTHLAANRGDSIATALKKTFQRGGVFGFYQGLIPWAWIEASTKGAVLIFTASEVEYVARVQGASPFMASIYGGMGGGIAQAYATMGFCTFMKTVEVTRHKGVQAGAPPPSTFKVAADIFRREGIRGINKGVNAVAVRQCTNWASRFGITRLAEETVLKVQGKSPNERLTVPEKIIASSFGGALSIWNQPIEVIRVEMQSQVKTAGRPEKMSIATAAKWIYKNNGFKGFYRGATPRIGLGIWQTICMVAFGDVVKAYIADRKNVNKV